MKMKTMMIIDETSNLKPGVYLLGVDLALKPDVTVINDCHCNFCRGCKPKKEEG